MKNEPIGVASITAVVIAILGLGAAFGLHITDDQQNAIVAAIVVWSPFYVWYQARKSTVPVDKANDHIEAALAIPATTKSEGFLFTKGS